MTWHFDHLAFSTPDGPALQDAFDGLLGLKPGRRPPFPFPGRWLYQDAQALVHVIEQPALEDTVLSHIAFRTDDDAALVLKRVQASGLPYQVAQVPEDGIWQIFVQMPGGLVIELDAKARVA
ncbi:hypothetical protein [Pseudomonas sp. B11(2017)]|uniref:hypothetical protein n=1 Tax=Pseudomonas sp. B11(2017) TaxID=1981748 RepID=UPI000A1EE9B4|nr:hypothetical protein [Pseudomonas sp. B11(2017)]